MEPPSQVGVPWKYVDISLLDLDNGDRISDCHGSTQHRQV